MSALDTLKAVGMMPADILLPQEGTDMQRWAVIACDQYTSQSDYWEKAEEFVGGAPSALRLIIPEVYLESEKGRALQESTVREMGEYLTDGILRTLPQSFIYVERITPYAPMRRGLVAAFDLDKYDFTPGNSMPIRATEGTILKRLPPRMAVRRQAELELPHIMILIDDPDGTVIEPLGAVKHTLEQAYDTDLMLGAGHVAGWRVHGEPELARIAAALTALNKPGAMLFAVGDGNHSLATAKACWEEIKPSLSEAERENHPARWALAELVNVHDAGLEFHPIHRVVFGADAAGLIAALLWEMNKRGWAASMGAEPTCAQSIEYVCEGSTGYLNIGNPMCPLAAGSLQQALDAVLEGMPEASIDYVHGDEAAEALGRQPGNTAFLLGVMDKAELFPAVERMGVLPRKAFSMGEADEKRFYMECRRIRV